MSRDSERQTIDFIREEECRGVEGRRDCLVHSAIWKAVKSESHVNPRPLVCVELIVKVKSDGDTGYCVDTSFVPRARLVVGVPYQYNVTHYDGRSAFSKAWHIYPNDTTD